MSNYTLEMLKRGNENMANNIPNNNIYLHSNNFINNIDLNANKKSRNKMTVSNISNSQDNAHPNYNIFNNVVNNHNNRYNNPLLNGGHKFSNSITNF